MTQTLAEKRRWNREHYPCGIKGCGRTAYRGALCRKHHDMIPYNDRIKGAVEVMSATMRAASKVRTRHLRLVRQKVASEKAV